MKNTTQNKRQYSKREENLNIPPPPKKGDKEELCCCPSMLWKWICITTHDKEPTIK